MDGRRLAGMAVLAAAVLVLAVVAGMGRPQVAGVANAPPIEPPPQVGDCLYAGREDWTTERPIDDDGSTMSVGVGVRLAPCQAPWDAEIVDVQPIDEQDGRAAAASDKPPAVFDSCAAGTRAFLAQPDFTDPEGRWIPAGPHAWPLPPDRRQFAAGQRWTACVLSPPNWGPTGTSATAVTETGFVRTGESQRGRWSDPTVRNRWGACSPNASDVGISDVGINFVFCGMPHDREQLAYTFWDTVPDAATLIDTCAAQTVRMTQQDDPSAGGALTTEVVVDDDSTASGRRTLDAAAGLDEHGSAACWVRPTDPALQLTGTVVGLGPAALPLAPR